MLKGGWSIPVGARGVLHEAYRYGDRIFDVTAANYIKPGFATADEIASAGLTDAVKSGIFTLEQHATFISLITRGR